MLPPTAYPGAWLVDTNRFLNVTRLIRNGSNSGRSEASITDLSALAAFLAFSSLVGPDRQCQPWSPWSEVILAELNSIGLTEAGRLGCCARAHTAPTEPAATIIGGMP
jgi:hypothetical protein